MFLTYLGATAGPQRLPGLDSAAGSVGVLRGGETVPSFNLPDSGEAESSTKQVGAPSKGLSQLLILYRQAERRDDSVPI